ncbi:unnamed protein product [Fasciola hepatica]|uniref:Uncharacterized protein n=1 Tax=Fasciola hepatica TaxID=6192 RepID=A0ABC9HH04_FASHE
MLTMECLTVLTACLTISALGQRTRDDFENLSTILQHLNRMLSIIKFGPIKRIGLFLRGKTPQGEMSINLPRLITAHTIFTLFLLLAIFSAYFGMVPKIFQYVIISQ